MRRDIIRIAHYYYELGLNQQEIADRMQVSRHTVNRSLKRAIEENIVQIRIVEDDGSHIQLEDQLRDVYKLHEAFVVDSGTQLGEAINHYLDRVLVDGQTVGITFGATLTQILAAPNPPQRRDGLSVVQMLGCLNVDSVAGKGRPDQLTHEIAAVLHASSHILFIPGIIENPELRRLFLQEPRCKEIYQLYDSIDISIAGIGAPTDDCTILQDGYMTREEYDSLVSRNCVGDIAMRFIDAEGCLMAPEFEDKVTGISLEKYKSIPIRVGMAYGSHKVKAIRAALKGNFTNVLITDASTAQRLLELS